MAVTQALSRLIILLAPGYIITGYCGNVRYCCILDSRVGSNNQMGNELVLGV